MVYAGLWFLLWRSQYVIFVLFPLSSWYLKRRERYGGKSKIAGRARSIGNEKIWREENPLLPVRGLPSKLHIFPQNNDGDDNDESVGTTQLHRSITALRLHHSLPKANGDICPWFLSYAILAGSGRPTREKTISSTFATASGSGSSHLHNNIIIIFVVPPFFK